jgi:hypothetical protein
MPSTRPRKSGVERRLARTRKAGTALDHAEDGKKTLHNKPLPQIMRQALAVAQPRLRMQVTINIELESGFSAAPLPLPLAVQAHLLLLARHHLNRRLLAMHLLSLTSALPRLAGGMRA